MKEIPKEMREEKPKIRISIEEEIRVMLEKKLHELLINENSNTEKYALLIKEEEDKTANKEWANEDAYHTSYFPAVKIAMIGLSENDSSALQRLKNKLKGSLLFDLGGTFPIESAEPLIGLDAQIWINRYIEQDLPTNPFKLIDVADKYTMGDEVLVPTRAGIKSDMLDFMSRVASDSQIKYYD